MGALDVMAAAEAVLDRPGAGNPSDYAANTVPLVKHTLPYRDIHGERVQALLQIDRELNT